MNQQIAQYVTKLWWLWVLFGIGTVLFGVVALVLPDLIIITAACLIAALVIMGAVFQVVRGVEQIKRRTDWWATVTIGVLLFVLGIFLAKDFTASIKLFGFLLGWVLVLRGLADLTIARFVDPEGSVWWKISAIVGVLTGVITIIYPLGGTVVFTWIIGIQALITGSIMLMRAWQVRAVLKRKHQKNEARKS